MRIAITGSKGQLGAALQSALADNDLLLIDLPELDMKDIQVNIENGTLSLKGERKFESEEKARGYHRIERSFGSFARSVRLPRVADPERIEASFDNGVLTVLVPKREEAKARTIEVTAK
jgi:HSP20 family protein